MCWEKPRGPGIALALGSAGCDAPAYTVACLLCGSGIHRDVSPVWLWQVIWLFGASTLFFLPVSKPLNKETMNYSCVVIGLVAVLAAMYAPPVVRAVSLAAFATLLHSCLFPSIVHGFVWRETCRPPVLCRAAPQLLDRVGPARVRRPSALPPPRGAQCSSLQPLRGADGQRVAQQGGPGAVRALEHIIGAPAPTPPLALCLLQTLIHLELSPSQCSLPLFPSLFIFPCSEIDLRQRSK